MTAKSLVFVGGVTASGKTALIEKVTQDGDELRWGVNSVAISQFMLQALKAKRPTIPEIQGRDKLGPEITLIEWKENEPKAIAFLSDYLGELRNDPTVKTVLINTHFATYSPGGFMVGLDPRSLLRICDASGVSSDKTKKVGVVLADIGIADALIRRQMRWHLHRDAGMAATELSRDLELNRLYSLQYYSVLSSYLGHERVMYDRFVIDYKSHQKLSTDEIGDLPDFKVTAQKFQDFLKRESFVG